MKAARPNPEARWQLSQSLMQAEHTISLWWDHYRRAHPAEFNEMAYNGLDQQKQLKMATVRVPENLCCCCGEIQQ